MKVKLLSLLFLGLASLTVGQPGKGPGAPFDDKRNEGVAQPGFVPGLDLDVNNVNNQKKPEMLGERNEHRVQEAEVDIIPQNLIKTEAIATADVPSDHMHQCVAIRLREYVDQSYAMYASMSEGSVDAAAASSSRKAPSSSDQMKAAQQITNTLSDKGASLLSLLNSYVKEGVVRKLRDEGAQLSPIYDYNCAYKCDYSNPMLVGYSAHHRICYDAKLTSASQVAQSALKSGATDMESMNHVASEKQQLKAELVAIQRATAEAFLKAQDIAFTLFLIQGEQFNKDKRHHMRPEELEEEERKKKQNSSYGMFNGYGYGMPFDEFFYDDRYDSGKGYDSNTFYDDFFHLGAFFNGAMKQKQNKERFEEPALQLVKIECKRIDHNQGEAGMMYPSMMRSDKSAGESMVYSADYSSSSSSYDYSRYYPMPKMMMPVAIAVTVKCELITQLVEEDEERKKHI